MSRRGMREGISSPGESAETPTPDGIIIERWEPGPRGTGWYYTAADFIHADRDLWRGPFRSRANAAHHAAYYPDDPSHDDVDEESPE